MRPAACLPVMAPLIHNRFCAHCGQPAVNARVEIDGTLTYLCLAHSQAAAPAQVNAKPVNGLPGDPPPPGKRGDR